jgi:hypothetical protein
MPERSRTRKGKELLMDEHVTIDGLAFRAQRDQRLAGVITQATDTLGCAGHARLRELLQIALRHGGEQPLPVRVSMAPDVPVAADPDGPLVFICQQGIVPGRPDLRLISIRRELSGDEGTVHAVLERDPRRLAPPTMTRDQFAVFALGVGPNPASIAPYRLDVGFRPDQQPDDATFGTVTGALAWLIAKARQRPAEGTTFMEEEIWIAGRVVRATLALEKFTRDPGGHWQVRMTVRHPGGPDVRIAGFTDGPHVSWWVHDLVTLATDG